MLPARPELAVHGPYLRDLTKPDVDGNDLKIGDAVELVDNPAEHPWGTMVGRRGVVHFIAPDPDHPGFAHPDDPFVTVLWTPDDPYNPGVVSRATHFRKVAQ